MQWCCALAVMRFRVIVQYVQFSHYYEFNPCLLSYQVADLKRELKLRGMAINGNKTELQERLQAALISDPMLDDTAICGEDLLDEDAVLSDESECKILDDNVSEEIELLKSPKSANAAGRGNKNSEQLDAGGPMTIGMTSDEEIEKATTPSTTTTTNTTAVNAANVSKKNNTSSVKSANDKSLNTSNEEDELLISPPSQGKKIVLKRKRSFCGVSDLKSTNNGSSSSTNNNENESAVSKEAVTIPAKISKKIENPPNTTIVKDSSSQSTKEVITFKSQKEIASLSVQERLEMRAKKFGITNNSNADKVKRSSGGGSGDIGVQDEKQLEILKKRAERFGCVTSADLAKIDAAEKLLKRKERFGILTNSGGAASKAGSSIGSSSKNDWAEKAKKRLERFSVDLAEKSSLATIAATISTNSN